MKCAHLPRFALALALSVSLLSAAVLAKDLQQPSTTVPAARDNDMWLARHQSINQRVRQGNVGMLMIGDSITFYWENQGAEVWKQYYARRNAANLGIGGDGTQQVLWRLDHGNIDGISPKLAVLMIGTNNAAVNTPADIAAGVGAIVAKLRAKLRRTKILVLAIFPRGGGNTDTLRQTNMAANKMIAKLADNKMVFYLDIGPKFLDKDGKLPLDVMPDGLHLSAKGYAIWAEAMEPTVTKLMGEKKRRR